MTNNKHICGARIGMATSGNFVHCSNPIPCPLHNPQGQGFIGGTYPPEEKCKKHGVVHKNGGYPSCLPTEEIKLIAGNEKDCICAKQDGKHETHCDDYRLKNFLVHAVGVIATANPKEISTKLTASQPPVAVERVSECLCVCHRDKFDCHYDCCPTKLAMYNPSAPAEKEKEAWEERFRKLINELDDMSVSRGVDIPIKGDIYFDGYEIEAFIKDISAQAYERGKNEEMGLYVTEHHIKVLQEKAYERGKIEQEKLCMAQCDPTSLRTQAIRDYAQGLREKIEGMKLRPDNSHIDEALRAQWNSALKAVLALLKDQEK